MTETATTTAPHTVAGRDVQTGQTIKDQGRWYTIQQFISNKLWDGTDMRVADALDAAGKVQRVCVFDGDTYPLRQAGKAAPIIIKIRTRRGDVQTVEITYRKRSWGGWRVVRADNGRELGWLTRNDDGWSAHVASSAFRGDTIDDEGDCLDDVPLCLFNGENALAAMAIGWPQAKREDAVEGLIRWLANERATALGFGPHHLVTKWADRH